MVCHGIESQEGCLARFPKKRGLRCFVWLDTKEDVPKALGTALCSTAGSSEPDLDDDV